MSSITSRIADAEREEQALHQQQAQATQVGGSHYLKAVQPWDIIRAWGLGFHRGNIIKYVLRSPGKNGKEDLEKAKHYLEYIIANYDALNNEGIL